MKEKQTNLKDIKKYFICVNCGNIYDYDLTQTSFCCGICRIEYFTGEIKK